jgi:hypothetical protein
LLGFQNVALATPRTTLNTASKAKNGATTPRMILLRKVSRRIGRRIGRPSVSEASSIFVITIPFYSLLILLACFDVKISVKR